MRQWRMENRQFSILHYPLSISMINPLLFFWLLLKASLFSTSGLGNLPILYDDLLQRGYATEHQFAEALAVGKISPGPTGLWVISLGYLMDGGRGAILATVAISLPPLLVIVLEQLYQRIGTHRMVQGFLQGLSLAVGGILFVIVVNMIREGGADSASLLIAAASVWLGTVRGMSFIALLALAALAGILIY